MRVRRLVWRHVPRGAEPLHAGWMQLARGRWNTQRPRIACLYTSSSADGALAFYASPKGAASVRFIATEASANSLTFTNAANDFPQRVRYTKTAAGVG